MENNMHIMVDLETMGTRPNAPIVSIGAVMFNADGIHERLYRNVSLASAVRSGAVIDPNTVMWWMAQSEDARTALVDETAGSIADALRDLGKMVCGPNDALVGVWGNGASFDNVIVSESCRRLGMAPLWEFWKDRCYRTVKSAYPDVKLERTGVHHNALSDAETQAEHLIRINEASGGIIL